MTAAGVEEAIVGFKLVHAGFSTFGVAKVRLRSGAVVDREIENHGSAAAVLPYDAERKVAFLIRQFRPAVLHAGGEPHLIEAPAGLLGEETPQTCARREAYEEVGVELDDLEPVGMVYSTPGISTERIHLFLAPYRPEQRTHPGGGLASEHEDLEVFEMPLHELASLADGGGLADLKTLTLVLALRVRHPELFGA